MPQAGEVLRDKMNDWFGDPISDQGPIKYLHEQGYKLTPQWVWIPKPGVTKYSDMTEKEYLCMLFLVDEWDFGGLIGKEV